jgi:hypothetical protein
VLFGQSGGCCPYDQPARNLRFERLTFTGTTWLHPSSPNGYANYVADAPYTGIGIGYGWGANDPGGAPDYINRGLYDFQPIYDTPTTLRDVRVVGNYISGVVQTMFDAGCVYMLSAMPGSRVDENYCENSGQLGLYFDEGTRYVSATRNVFVNNAGQWAHANIQNGHRIGDLTLVENYATNPAIPSSSTANAARSPGTTSRSLPRTRRSRPAGSSTTRVRPAGTAGLPIPTGPRSARSCRPTRAPSKRAAAPRSPRRWATSATRRWPG